MKPKEPRKLCTSSCARDKSSYLYPQDNQNSENVGN